MAGKLRGANVAIGARKTPIRSTSVEYGTTTGSTCVDSMGNLTARSRWIVLRRSTMDRKPMIFGRRRLMAVTIALTWSRDRIARGDGSSGTTTTSAAARVLGESRDVPAVGQQPHGCRRRRRAAAAITARDAVS